MASITIKDIPDDLHLALKHCASENGRSINREVIMRLNESCKLKNTNPQRTVDDLSKFRESLQQVKACEIDEAILAARRH